MSRIRSADEPVRGRLRRVLTGALTMVVATTGFVGFGAAAATVANAGTLPDGFTSEPASPTVLTGGAATLSWDISVPVVGGVTPTCSATLDGASTPVSSCSLSGVGVETGTATIDATQPGTYVLTVTVPATPVVNLNGGPYPSDPVTVVQPIPDPPVLHGPSGPSTNQHPSFTVDADSGATLDCTLTAPGGSPVALDSGDCSSSGITPTLDPANLGTYTLDVTQTVGGQTSDPGTARYDLEQPAAPTVTLQSGTGVNVAGQTGYSTSPSFAVSGLDTADGATLTCAVTDSSGTFLDASDVTCGPTEIDLDLDPSDQGVYTLTVTQSADGLNSDATTPAPTYLLDTHTPATITITAPTSPAASASPAFTLANVESGDSLSCPVTGPAGSTITQATSCGATTTLNLTGQPNGTYALTATQTDAAGKSSTTSDPATYVYEGNTPGTPTVTRVDTSPGKTLKPTFTVAGLDALSDLTPTCTLTGPAGSTATVASNVTCGLSSIAVDLSTATMHPDGTYTVTESVKDGVGQSSIAGSASYVLDTTTPTPTVTAVSDVTTATMPSKDTSPTFDIEDTEAVSRPEIYSCTLSYNGGTAQAVACAAGVQHVSMTQGDGTYVLKVTAEDALLNSNSASATYYLDATTPVPTITRGTPATSPSNDTTPTFTVSDVDPIDGADTLSCVWTGPGGTNITTNCTAGSLSGGATKTKGDGTYTLTVTATDKSTQHNTNQTSITYVLDTLAMPPVVSSTAPATSATNYSRMADPVVTATGQDVAEGPDTTFLCSLITPGGATPAYTACGGSYTINLVTGTSSQAITVTTATEGKYALRVEAEDKLGNISTPVEYDYWYDGSTPNPTIVAKNPNKTTSITAPANVTSPTFTIGYADTGSGVKSMTCAWTGPTSDFGGNSITPTVNVTTCPTPSGGGVYQFSTAADGEYTLTVTGTDNAGNTNFATVDYWLRTGAPAPTVAVATGGSALHPDKTLTPSFTISDSDPVAGPDTLSCQWQTPKQATPPAGAACVAGTTAFSANQGDGEYRLFVTGKDTLGNASPTVEADYFLDTTAQAPTFSPTASSLSSATSYTDIANPSITISGGDSVEGPDSFSCTLTGPSGALSSPCTGTVQTGPGGIATLGVTIPTVAGDGKYALVVTATDQLMNVSPTAEFDYYYDGTIVAPSITPATPATTTSESAPAKVTSPSFGISFADATSGVQSLTCTWTGPIDGFGGASATPTINVTTCPTPDGSGHYSFPTALDGEYHLSVRGVDKAGNSATTDVYYWLHTSSSATVSIAPSQPNGVTAQGAPSATTTPSFVVTGTDPIAGPDTLNCTWTGPILDPAGRTATATVNTTGCDANPSLSNPLLNTYGFTTAADGEYELSVYATDTAGNSTLTKKFDYWLDATTPQPVVAPVAPGVQTTQSAQSNVGSPSFALTDSESISGPDTFSCEWKGPIETGLGAPQSAPYAVDTTTCPTPNLAGNYVFNTAASNGDGEYDLTVKATDQLGNANSVDYFYWYDSGTPTPSIVLQPAGAIATQSAPSTNKTPSFAITDVDPVSGNDTLTCEWTGPVSDFAGNPLTAKVDQTTCPTPDGSGLYDIPTGWTNGDGEYTLKVTGTDKASNTASYTYDYWLEATTPAPTVTPVAPTVSTLSSARSNVASPTYAITDVDPVSGNNALTCTWTGPNPDGNGNPAAATINLTSCPSVDGAGRYVFPTAADGEYVLTVIGEDALHNKATTVVDYFLDTTTAAPTVTLATPTSSPSRVRKPTFTITDSEQWSTPETYKCVWTPPASSGAPAQTSACVSGVQYDATLTGEGTYTLTVSATDSLRNTMTAGTPIVPSAIAQTTVSYTVDRSTPDPVIGLVSTPAVSTAVGAAAGTAITPQFRLTDAETVSKPETLTCTWTGPGNTSISSTCPVPTADAANGGTADIYSFPTAGLGDGTYTLAVSAQDALLNTVDPAGATALASFSYTLDTVTPAPTVTPSGLHGQSTMPVFSITEPATETTTPEAFTCAWQDPNGTVLSDAACTSGASFSTVDQPGGLSTDGTYTLTVSAADALGNSHTALPVTAADLAQTVVSYVLDRSTPAPVIVLTSRSETVPGHPNPVSNVTAPTFVLSDSEALSTLTLACEWTGPGNTGITTDCTGGLGIGATATNGDGTYTLAVTATDGAGNTNSARFSYELDTTPPRAPTVSSSVDTNQRTVTFQVGGLEANSTFTCVVTGTDVTAVTSPDCAGGSVSSGVGTRQSNGTYTVPVTVTLGGSVPDGVYVLSVTPTDDADNSGSAGTATYQLDTIAPPAPLVNVATASPSRNTQPLWSWQYAHNTTTEDAADQATCTITDPQGALTQTPCPTPTVVTKSPVLGDGGDGLYTFTVTVTDPAGNTGTSTDAYDFEHTAPDAPSIYIVSPAASSGRSAHPVWAVVGPAGASLTCELHDGMSKTDPVIAGPEPCSGTVTFDLTGKLDGGYTASVKASGSSSIAGWTYVLAPKAPRVSPPTSKGTPAVWTVTGNPADQFFCTLTKGTSFISGPGPCDAHPSYDMRHLPRGTYTLIVLQEGPENVTGANGSASWFWDGVSTSSPTTPVAPSGPNPTGPVTHPKKPKLPKPVGDLFKGLLGKGPHGISQVVKPQALTKLPTPSGLGDSGLGGGLAKGLRGAVSAITTAGGGTGFPLILLALVIAFLIAQNRIDRRDPKLAFASAAADDMVDFSPPPSRRDSL